MLTPPKRATAPERILAYGGPGQGKSAMWIDIAQKMHEQGNPGKVVVIDSDNAVEAMFGEGYGHLADRVVNFPVYGWADLRDAKTEIVGMNLTIEDWLVHDMISFPYTEVRQHYVNTVLGMDLEDYLVETAKLINMARAEGAKGHEKDFGDFTTKEWTHMAKIYLAYEVPLVMRMKCHVLALAEERDVDEHRGATATQIKRYKMVGGSKPYVNNTAEHRFRSVMRVLAPGDHFELKKQKDRYRIARWEKKATRNTLNVGDMNEDGGFVKAYLMGIARWRIRGDG